MINIQQFFSSLLQMDRKKQYLVFGGVFFLFLLSDVIFIMGPQLGKLSQLNTEIETKRQELESLKVQIKQIPQFQEALGKRKFQMEDFKQRVKLKQEIPLVLEKLSRMATEYVIEIDQMMPNAEAQQMILTDQSNQYSALPIQVEARGGFHHLGRFLNHLETDDVLFSLDRFSIVSNINDYQNHKFQLTVKTVVLEQVKKESASVEDSSKSKRMKSSKKKKKRSKK